MKIAIIAITRDGARLGQRLRNGLGNASLFVLQKYRGEAGKDSVPFTGELKELVKRLWPDHQGFIFIMATGIVVRVIAPLIEAKDADPAVVVMDDVGKFAISLLSGHLGGANELAARCALNGRSDRAGEDRLNRKHKQRKESRNRDRTLYPP